MSVSNNTFQGRNEVAVAQRRLLKIITMKHELDVSWWRASSYIKWLHMNNDDTTERESLCSRDGVLHALFRHRPTGTGEKETNKLLDG